MGIIQKNSMEYLETMAQELRGHYGEVYDRKALDAGTNRKPRSLLLCLLGVLLVQLNPVIPCLGRLGHGLLYVFFDLAPLPRLVLPVLLLEPVGRRPTNDLEHLRLPGSTDATGWSRGCTEPLRIALDALFL